MEFALAAPVLIVVILLALQLSQVMLASNVASHSVGVGARFLQANVAATPTEVLDYIELNVEVLDNMTISPPVITSGVDPVNSVEYREIDVTVSVDTNIPFFTGKTVTFDKSRRVYI